MSKIFIIPDIHLKPNMLLVAEEILENSSFDEIVFLGDIPDDWNQEFNVDLYEETFETVADFMRRHENVFFCYGNHDVSYVWQAMESGYSVWARDAVLDGLDKIREFLPPWKIGFIHRVDDVIFSHAGLTKAFVERCFPEDAGDIDKLIDKINQCGEKELWRDDSPIWARPQDGNVLLYPEGFMQVVGHTPVSAPQEIRNLLTLDTFSTYRDGSNIGDARFVYVDSVEKSWNYV